MIAFIAASILVSVYQNTVVGWVEPWKTAILGYWWSRIVAFVLVTLFATPPLVGGSDRFRSCCDDRDPFSDR